MTTQMIVSQENINEENMPNISICQEKQLWANTWNQIIIVSSLAQERCSSNVYIH